MTGPDIVIEAPVMVAYATMQTPTIGPDITITPPPMVAVAAMPMPAELSGVVVCGFCGTTDMWPYCERSSQYHPECLRLINNPPPPDTTPPPVDQYPPVTGLPPPETYSETLADHRAECGCTLEPNATVNPYDMVDSTNTAAEEDYPDRVHKDIPLNSQSRTLQKPVGQHMAHPRNAIQPNTDILYVQPITKNPPKVIHQD
jgi:hypothetical protein